VNPALPTPLAWISDDMQRFVLKSRIPGDLDHRDGVLTCREAPSNNNNPTATRKASS
jgi:hypothetical protein